jgi:hypothetical protein
MTENKEITLRLVAANAHINDMQRQIERLRKEIYVLIMNAFGSEKGVKYRAYGDE